VAYTLSQSLLEHREHRAGGGGGQPDTCHCHSAASVLV